MPDTLNAAIVGCGSIASVCRRSAVDGVRLAACADIAETGVRLAMGHNAAAYRSRRYAGP